MRMRQISAETGLEPSTIHFYLRQGLVPPPEKPTRNSALYSEVHVRRLRLIRRMRDDRLPLASIRRVLELVDRGVEPEVAVELHRAVAGGSAVAPGAEAGFDAAALAEQSGLAPEMLERLIAAGVLVPAPGADPPFDAADLRIAIMIREFFKRIPARLEDLAEIAGLLREASAREMALRDRATRSFDTPAAAELSARLQEWVNLWHVYLFSRLRQQEIVVHDLGVATPGKKEATP
jgi:DNA-binding transcriptional MerR regulator